MKTNAKLAGGRREERSKRYKDDDTMESTTKKINLDGVKFSFDDLSARPISYRRLIKAHLEPAICLRKEDETKDDYLKRIFNTLFNRFGYVETND